MSQTASGSAIVWQTIRDALALNSRFYENARSSQKSRRAALAIVIFAALSRALGNAVISLLNRITLPAFLIAFLLSIFVAIVGYYFWTFTLWQIGQWFKLDPPSYRDLLYPIGFAYSPQIFNVMTLIPLLGTSIELLLAVWTLLAVAVAVREAMQITAIQAVLLSLISFPVIQILSAVIQVASQQFTQ